MRRARAFVWIGLGAVACGGGGVGGAPDAAFGRADAGPRPVDAAPADAPGGACVADTPAALVACGAAVSAGSADTIEVRGQLDCSGADACKVDIESAPGPYVIRGAPGAAIRREDHYDYNLFKLVAPVDVTVQDLIIDERADAPCLPIEPVNPPVENLDCVASIFVYGAPHLLVDHVTIAHAKAQALLVAVTPNVTISHSRFADSHEFGAQISNLNGSLLFEDSLIWHSASNGIVLYDAHGTAASPLLVVRSMWQHNHLNSIFYQCGPSGGEPCNGGQFLAAGLVNFLRVEASVIVNGYNEEFPELPIGGVELNPPSIKDITFVGNDIHNNDEWAIALNPNQVDCARVYVTDNKMYGNATAMYYNGVNVGNFDPGIAVETGTCDTPTCRIVAFGALWATPADGVSWTSNDLASPQVTVNGTLASADASGVIHPAAGAEVVLLDGTTEIDRLVAP